MSSISSSSKYYVNEIWGSRKVWFSPETPFWLRQSLMPSEFCSCKIHWRDIHRTAIPGTRETSESSKSEIQQDRLRWILSVTLPSRAVLALALPPLGWQSSSLSPGQQSCLKAEITLPAEKWPSDPTPRQSGNLSTTPWAIPTHTKKVLSVKNTTFHFKMV